MPQFAPLIYLSQGGQFETDGKGVNMSDYSTQMLATMKNS